MGLIGTEKRFISKDNDLKTPGVGQYNLESFKSLYKASQSSFDMRNLNIIQPASSREPVSIIQNQSLIGKTVKLRTSCSNSLNRGNEN